MRTAAIQISAMTRGGSMGQSGSCMLVSLLVLSLAVESHSSLIRRQVGNNDQCSMNGYFYNTGKVLAVPGGTDCWKLRCDIEGWFLYEEGCKDKKGGVCQHVGSTYVDQCVTYTCSASSVYGSSTYQSTVVSAKCPDYDGVCFDNGSLYSVRYPNNSRRNNCTCVVEGDSANYVCPHLT